MEIKISEDLALSDVMFNVEDLKAICEILIENGMGDYGIYLMDQDENIDWLQQFQINTNTKKVILRDDCMCIRDKYGIPYFIDKDGNGIKIGVGKERN